MVWILLVVIADSRSITMEHLEFVGRDQCEEARTIVEQQLKDELYWRTSITVCLNKGEVR